MSDIVSRTYENIFLYMEVGDRAREGYRKAKEEGDIIGEREFFDEAYFALSNMDSDVRRCISSLEESLKGGVFTDEGRKKVERNILLLIKFRERVNQKLTAMTETKQARDKAGEN